MATATPFPNSNSQNQIPSTTNNQGSVKKKGPNLCKSPRCCEEKKNVIHSFCDKCVSPFNKGVRNVFESPYVFPPRCVNATKCCRVVLHGPAAVQSPPPIHTLRGPPPRMSSALQLNPRHPAWPRRPGAPAPPGLMPRSWAGVEGVEVVSPGRPSVTRPLFIHSSVHSRRSPVSVVLRVGGGVFVCSFVHSLFSVSVVMYSFIHSLIVLRVSGSVFIHSLTVLRVSGSAFIHSFTHRSPCQW